MGKVRTLAEFEAWLEQRSAGYPPPAAEQTFNAFLRDHDSEHARWIAEDLDRHGVTIRAWYAMADFIERHPQYFRKTTPHEIAAGLETVQSLWCQYEEQRRIAQAIPLRPMRPYARSVRDRNSP